MIPCANINLFRIQELLSEDTTDCGRIPRTLDCELFDDLVDSVTPGENVIISGILHVLDLDESKVFCFLFLFYFYLSRSCEKFIWIFFNDEC